jgi:hypothetical protein
MTPTSQMEIYRRTVMMLAVRSSETSVNFDQTIRRHIPEDGNFRSHRPGNLKSGAEWLISSKHALFKLLNKMNTENICFI